MKKITALLMCIMILISHTAIAKVYDNEAIGESEIISYAIFKDGKKVLGSEGTEAYAIGSISKIFTAALVLKLAEEKLISVDGKITDYLPEFEMEDERYKDITIGMLLNHTSGLLGSTLKNTILYKDKDSWNHDNFLSLLKEQRLKYNPGEMANYGNDGYTLLELIIENVTKMSYTEYLHEVFDDFWDNGNLQTASELTGRYDEVVNSIASCGIYSDADTVCKLIYFITCTDALIKESSRIDMMMIRDNALPGEYFGFGWDNVSAYPFAKYGIKALSKEGDTLDYHSGVIVLPEYGMTACVIMKGGEGKIATAKAASLILDYLKEHLEINVEFYEYEKPESGNLDDFESLGKYEGLYLSNEEQYVVNLEDGRAIIGKLWENEVVRLNYLGNGIFDTGSGILYFKEINGNTYIIREGTEELGIKERALLFDYFAVKKENFIDIGNEWTKRSGKVYLICDEKYTSALYMKNIVSETVLFKDMAQGYMGYLKVSDDFTALSDIAIPGNYGRDLKDIKVFTESGREYIKAGGWTYRELSSVPKIYSGEKSVCSILNDGYTRWFKSGDAKGKKIDAEIKGNGMFALYNSSGICIYSSLRDEFEAIIPEGGYIAFAGDNGTVFEITLAS